MAATGFTPIAIYHSITAGHAPTAGQLVDGELAINTADGKLFYKNSTGGVSEFTAGTGTAGPTGPTGPTGAASTVAGPTGSTGPTGPTGSPGTTLTNWTIVETAGVLYFKYSGVSKFSLDSSGNLIVVGNNTAYGSI